MKISVLLPISNDAQQSFKAINSILIQSYRNFEILVCLNGNSQKFEKKLKSNFKKIKKIKFFKIKEKNIVPALNKLISEANGDYCARIDADDIAKKNRFSKQVELIKKNKLDFLSTNCHVLGKKNMLLYNHKTIFKKFLYTNPIVHPTIIVKTSLLKKFHYKMIPYAEDYELYLRLWLNGLKFNNLNDNLIIYTLNIKNIKNKKRAFFLFLSTLVISKSFRSRNEVNENFFKKIKYQKKFGKSYDEYVDKYLLSESIFKYLTIFNLILFGNFLIKKNILNKIYFFNNNFKFNSNRKITSTFKKKIKKPLVSFVIPTYNSHNTIYETIKSIKSQTYKNYEIIVVDNSFDNKTVNIINKYFKNIKVVRVKNKILPAEARNIGVKYSNKNSKFISFCDSDDVIKPEKTETQIDIMLEEDLNASCTNVDFYDQLTGKMKKNFFMIPYNFIDFEILSFKNLIATSSVILTKKIFNSVNGFSESKYFYSFEDYFLWLKVTNKCKFRFIDQNLTIYRDDRKNSASSNSKHIIEQRIRLILFYLSKFEFYNLKNLILGNFLLVKSWFLRKFLKRNRSEYFDLL